MCGVRYLAAYLPGAMRLRALGSKRFLKVDLRTCLVTGAETLVRWQHPERGDRVQARSGIQGVFPTEANFLWIQRPSEGSSIW